jgi:hypothetical protein
VVVGGAQMEGSWSAAHWDPRQEGPTPCRIRMQSAVIP